MLVPFCKTVRVCAKTVHVCAKLCKLALNYTTLPKTVLDCTKLYEIALKCARSCSITKINVHKMN